jgi:hypothetical protein
VREKERREAGEWIRVEREEGEETGWNERENEL